MDNNVRLGMQEESGLLANRRHNFWVAMTSVCDADPTSKIEVFPAISRVNVRSFRSLRFDGKYPGPDWGHVWKTIRVKFSGHLTP
jgi:hypothetical protein